MGSLNRIIGEYFMNVKIEYIGMQEKRNNLSLYPGITARIIIVVDICSGFCTLGLGHVDSMHWSFHFPRLAVAVCSSMSITFLQYPIELYMLTPTKYM